MIATEHTQAPAASPIEWDADQLFFSTTDARGVIEKANSVFVTISGHPRERLIGAPHNIIRHPEMPGGAFRLMWDTLCAKKPFCAYVVNQAADGRPYTVFATVTPLGEGYLSVRSRPCAEELLQAALNLYQQARPVEQSARAQGASAAAAAEEGLSTLAELLPSAGIANYTEFIETALPAEVLGRIAQGHRLPQRFGGGPLFTMLAAAHRIDEQLGEWLERLDLLAEVAQELTRTATALNQLMGTSHRTADEVAQSIPDGVHPIMLAVQVWASILPELDVELAGFGSQLTELAASCSHSRFRIALARLHNDATAQFIAELIDAAGNSLGAAAIADLCRALDEGITETDRHCLHNAALARGVAEQIETAIGLMALPQGLLTSWREKADQRSDEMVAAIAPRITGQADQTTEALAQLARLAETCREIATPIETSGVREQVRLMVQEVPNVSVL